MNIALKSAGWHLTIDLDDCCAPTNCSAVHPDNTGTLNAAYSLNSRDVYGMVHNLALTHYRNVEKQGDSEGDMLRAIGEFLKTKPVAEPPFNKDYFTDLDEFIQHAMKSNMWEELDTIFWPELPDPWFNKRFNDLLNRADSFDVRTDSYKAFYSDCIVIDDHLLKTDLDDELRELFLGTMSVLRHSTANAVEQVVGANPDDNVNVYNVRPGRIIRADVRAFRWASKQPNYNEGDVINRTAGASAAAERGG